MHVHMFLVLYKAAMRVVRNSHLIYVGTYVCTYFVCTHVHKDYFKPGTRRPAAGMHLVSYSYFYPSILSANVSMHVCVCVCVRPRGY